MNKMGVQPGQPAQPGQPGQAPTGQTTQTAQTPTSSTTGMSPDRLVELGKDPTVAGVNMDPSGKWSMNWHKPAEFDLNELTNVVGGGKSSSPFLEALLKMQ